MIFSELTEVKVDFPVGYFKLGRFTASKRKWHRECELTEDIVGNVEEIFDFNRTIVAEIDKVYEAFVLCLMLRNFRYRDSADFLVLQRQTSHSD